MGNTKPPLPLPLNGRELSSEIQQRHNVGHLRAEYDCLPKGGISMISTVLKKTYLGRLTKLLRPFQLIDTYFPVSTHTPRGFYKFGCKITPKTNHKICFCFLEIPFPR